MVVLLVSPSGIRYGTEYPGLGSTAVCYGHMEMIEIMSNMSADALDHLHCSFTEVLYMIPMGK